MAAGSDALLLITGVVNVPTRADFEAGNATATAHVVDAARGAGVTRFVHVSSLAAREPGLSDYGWSKARSETIVRASGLDWTIVRPPAVFGPGDTEMRSEEHTSELQSLMRNLVCRLLLEKKNNTHKNKQT